MIYDLALQLSIAVCLWVVIDLVGARGPRAARAPFALLAGGALLWILGERMTFLGTSDAEILLGRRVLFLGASLVPAAWLWTGAAAARAPSSGRRPWLFALAAVPLLAIYSALWWSSDARFVHPTQRPPVHGPWFLPFAALAWIATLAGTALMLRAGWLRRRRADWRVLAISAAALLPLGANVLHVFFLKLPFDPTPVALGISGVLVRYAVIESGIGGFVPVGGKRLLDQLPTGLLVSDATGHVVYANSAARALVGPDDPVGTSIGAIVESAERDASRRIEAARVPILGRAGSAGSATLLTDRTDRRRLEQRLVEAQRLEAVAILAAGVAHEINNPLAVIIGNLALLEDFAKDAAAAAERGALTEALRREIGDVSSAVTDASHGATRIQRIVQSLTSLVRTRERGEPRLVDVGLAVRRAAALASAALPPESLRTALAPTARVAGHEEDLVQIVFHLLMNAVQASEGAPDVELEVGPRDGGIVIEVRDRGPGFHDEALAHLFDPFYTTRRPTGGPGLGLSLCLSLARRHGGWIEAENRLGGGAALRVWLPAANEEGASGERAR
ncbi:MAG TPA: ATP-binding protein [Myxococcota bacterium]|nr:ATP-binding protein [Myxococcota bacterium]